MASLIAQSKICGLLYDKLMLIQDSTSDEADLYSTPSNSKERSISEHGTPHHKTNDEIQAQLKDIEAPSWALDNRAVSQLQNVLREELSRREARELSAFRRIHISTQNSGLSLWRVGLIYFLLRNWIRRHFGAHQQHASHIKQIHQLLSTRIALNQIVKYSFGGVADKVYNIIRPLKRSLYSLQGQMKQQLYLAVAKAPPRSQHLVVIKTVTLSLGFAQEDNVREAAQEVLLMQGIEHDNLARFYASFYDAGKEELSVVSEFASETSLSDVLIRASPFSFPEDFIAAVTVQVCSRVKSTTVLLIAIKICQGLGYLHSKRIVHRDIRSGNIAVGGRGRVKICEYLSIFLAQD